MKSKRLLVKSSYRFAWSYGCYWIIRSDPHGCGIGIVARTGTFFFGTRMDPAPDPGTSRTTPKWPFYMTFGKFAGKKYLKFEYDVRTSQIRVHFDR